MFTAVEYLHHVHLFSIRLNLLIQCMQQLPNFACSAHAMSCNTNFASILLCLQSIVIAKVDFCIYFQFLHYYCNVMLLCNLEEY